MSLNNTIDNGTNRNLILSPLSNSKRMNANEENYRKGFMVNNSTSLHSRKHSQPTLDADALFKGR